MMEKKKWVNPVLTVLTRGGDSSEMVLDSCKLHEISAGHSTFHNTCTVSKELGAGCDWGCYELRYS